MRLLAILVVVMIVVDSRPADADEPLTITTTLWPDRRIDGSAYLAAETDSRAGSGVAAGAELAIGAGGCGTVSTSGQLAARTGASTWSATHVLRACIETLHLVDTTTEVDVVIFPISVDHTLHWQTLPAFAARREVWNLPYTSERIEGQLALASLAPEMLFGWTLLALPIDVRGEWWAQTTTGGDRLYAAHHEIAASMIEAREAGGDGEIIGFRASFADGIDRLDLVRASKLPIAHTPLRVDFALGSAEKLRYVDGMFERTGDLTARLGLAVDLGRFRVGVAGERDFYPTIDDAIMKEQRAEVELSYRADARRSVVVTGYAARSTLYWTDGSGEVPYPSTFGVDLRASWPVYKNVEARLGLGWGRSFYANPAEMAPTPSLGFVGDGQILVRFDP